MSTLIEAGEAAKMLNCTRQNLDALRKSGRLSAVRTNKNRWAYDRAEVEAYVASKMLRAKPSKQVAAPVGEQLAANLAEQIKPLLDALKAPYESQIADLKADKDRLEKRNDELQKKLDEKNAAPQGWWRWSSLFRKS